MPPWLVITTKILFALFLVALNGFFVAAEFALVKVRGSRLGELVKEGRAFSGTAMWLSRRLDASLSCCQLGITIASLALGWVGEPVFAQLLRPMLVADTVSALISTSNQFCGLDPSAITVRQTPSQAIDAPMSIPATS